MKHVFAYILFLIPIAFSGCDPGTGSADSMAFGDVKYVSGFERSFDLPPGESIDLDIPGAINFVIRDSLLIFYSNHGDGFWNFFSVEDFTSLGSHLRRGNGPDEFLSSPSLNQSVFFVGDDRNHVAIYDFGSGRMLDLDITASLETGKTEITASEEILQPYLPACIPIGDDTFFCKEITHGQGRQERFIHRERRKTVPANLEQLNRAAVEHDEEFNLLSTLTKYHTKRGKVVEMPLYFKHLNIYSPDDTPGFTVCLGRKLQSVGEVERSKPHQRVYSFDDMRLYDDFLSVLYIDTPVGDYERGRYGSPTVLIFDWDGKPLAEIKLKERVTGFEIDRVSGFLYTYDFHSESFIRYYIKPVLEAIGV